VGKEKRCMVGFFLSARASNCAAPALIVAIRAESGQPKLADRPQIFWFSCLCRVVYCCIITTLGVSPLKMQASLVPLMTMQLIPLLPLPTR